jgi:hypothetical protein
MYIVFNRFLGTTPDSSTIGPLLKSLIRGSAGKDFDKIFEVK